MVSANKQLVVHLLVLPPVEIVWYVFEILMANGEEISSVDTNGHNASGVDTPRFAAYQPTICTLLLGSTYK